MVLPAHLEISGSLFQRADPLCCHFFLPALKSMWVHFLLMCVFHHLFHSPLGLSLWAPVQSYTLYLRCIGLVHILFAVTVSLIIVSHRIYTFVATEVRVTILCVCVCVCVQDDTDLSLSVCATKALSPPLWAMEILSRFAFHFLL